MFKVSNSQIFRFSFYFPSLSRHFSLFLSHSHPSHILFLSFAPPPFSLLVTSPISISLPLYLPSLIISSPFLSHYLSHFYPSLSLSLSLSLFLWLFLVIQKTKHDLLLTNFVVLELVNRLKRSRKMDLMCWFKAFLKRKLKYEEQINIPTLHIQILQEIYLAIILSNYDYSAVLKHLRYNLGLW